MKRVVNIVLWIANGLIIAVIVVAGILYFIDANKYNGVATINDVAVAQKNGQGFRITKVDGLNPTRKSGIIIDYVPFVVVDPGRHTFEVSNIGNGEDPKTMTISADILVGRRYNIFCNNGIVELKQ